MVLLSTVPPNTLSVQEFMVPMLGVFYFFGSLQFFLQSGMVLPSSLSYVLKLTFYSISEQLGANLQFFFQAQTPLYLTIFFRYVIMLIPQFQFIQFSFILVNFHAFGKKKIDKYTLIQPLFWRILALFPLLLNILWTLLYWKKREIV